MRYPEYKDSGVAWLGKIPAHWEAGRLKKTVSECQNGVWGEDPDGTNDIACIRVADFDRDTFSVDLSSLTLRRVDPRALSTHRLGRGDLLLEKSGGGERQPVGAVVIFADNLPAVCSNFIARMPVNDGHNPVFLVYLHAALYSSRINVRSIKQSIGIQNLDSDSYLNEKVGLPPLDEQHEIAMFLDRETAKVEALIAKQQELIGLLQEKRTALISHAVTKGLDAAAVMKDSGVEWLGKIPAHWAVLQLRRVAFDRCDGPFGSGLKSTHYAEDGLRVVRLQNIGHGEFEGADAAFIPQEHYLKLGDHSVLPGDLLIAGLGDTNHPAGRACVAPADIGSAMVKADCFRFRLDQSRVQPQFLALQLSATASIVSGLMSTGATRQRTSLASTAARAIAIPDPQEQSRIVDYVTRQIVWLDHAQHAVQRAIDHLNEYRTALISAAVTGKIDVRRAHETDTAPNPDSPQPAP